MSPPGPLFSSVWTWTLGPLTDPHLHEGLRYCHFVLYTPKLKHTHIPQIGGVSGPSIDLCDSESSPPPNAGKPPEGGCMTDPERLSWVISWMSEK